MIRAEELTKIYKTGDAELAALDNVSFEVEKGAFVAITGRSGSGKSTLLYQLGLLDHPTSGKVFLEGREVSSSDEDARTDIRLHDLGYVFQDYALVPELSAVENVIVPLLMQGIAYRNAKERAMISLTRVGLGERADHLPSQLSGGEQQRVSIARAIGHNPKIIFADEPTANLDTETATTVLKVFQELHASGQTIVMVTHEPEYAKLADRIVMLHDGKIVDEKKE